MTAVEQLLERWERGEHSLNVLMCIFELREAVRKDASAARICTPAYWTPIENT